MNRKVKAKDVKVTRRGRTSTSRVSTQHQVTVPVDILRAIGLEAGDIVKFEIKDGAIVMAAEMQAGHPLGLLIGAGNDDYKDFDLAKERESMWPR
jgi:bifunctional DNA-binding transcriptional regulator/antitoxin component of YhaV-PrlF toxin-antitoxin module